MDKADKLQFKYESLAGWIEKADLKAQILVGVQLFILGYVLENQADNFNWSGLSWLLLFGFIFCSLGSLYHLYRIIRPRLSNKIFGSMTYFRDLAKQAAQDYVKTKELLKTEDEQGFIDDMADQVLALAKVCNEKHEFLLTAEKFLVAGFSIGIVMYIVNLLSC